jgi:hypothetical protein
MPIKNIIVRMADRLRAGEAGADKGTAKHVAADSFASRQNILSRLRECLAARIKADARYSPIRCVAKPDPKEPVRIVLVHGERILTVRIARDAEYYTVSGSGLGKRFSANPAHMQSDEIVLLVADESATLPFGAEVTANDFLEDLVGKHKLSH